MCALHVPWVPAGVSSELPGGCDGSPHSRRTGGLCTAGQVRGTQVLSQALGTRGHTQGTRLRQAEKRMDWERSGLKESAAVPDSGRRGGPGSSHAQTRLPGLPPASAKATALGQGLSLKELAIPAGATRTGLPTALTRLGAPWKPQPGNAPLRSQARTRPTDASLPDREVSPQQHHGPQGGLRLPGECDHPRESCLPGNPRESFNRSSLRTSQWPAP